MKTIEILPEHYPQIAEIYLQGISTGMATFQKEAPDWENWNNNHLKHSRLAILDNSELMGWASLSPVSSRCVYSGVAEVSIYISANSRNKGVGTRLLTAIIKESERNGIWTLQSGIFTENIPSIKLHKKCGFREIGYREKIGQMDGIWKDTIILERRSKMVGL